MYNLVIIHLFYGRFTTLSPKPKILKSYLKFCTCSAMLRPTCPNLLTYISLYNFSCICKQCVVCLLLKGPSSLHFGHGLQSFGAISSLVCFIDHWERTHENMIYVVMSSNSWESEIADYNVGRAIPWFRFSLGFIIFEVLFHYLQVQGFLGIEIIEWNVSESVIVHFHFDTVEDYYRTLICPVLCMECIFLKDQLFLFWYCWGLLSYSNLPFPLYAMYIFLKAKHDLNNQTSA